MTKAIYRHEVTYTIPVEGAHLEQHTIVRHPRPLTYRGVERKLRSSRRNNQLVVTRLDYCVEY